MNTPDFSEFPPSTYEDWKKLAQKELGEKPMESLVWKNENGFEMPPYFQGGKKLAVPVTYPERCMLRQEIAGTDLDCITSMDEIAVCNKIMIQALEGGAESIAIPWPMDDYSGLAGLLKGVQLEMISLEYLNINSPCDYLQALQQYCEANNFNTKNIRGSIAHDPVSYQLVGNDPAEEMRLAKEMGWDIDLGGETKLDHLLKTVKFSREHFPLIKPVTITTEWEAMWGGTSIQQIAKTLSAGKKYLEIFMDAGYTIDQACALIQFNFGVSTGYFESIAMLRSFRMLWAKLVEQYKPEDPSSVNCFIHAETGTYHLTLRDAHTNLVRTTTQAMSAILGGANSLYILPYDLNHQPLNSTTMRWAMNIHHLLHEESFINEARTAANGSFYIEELTYALAKASWGLFQYLESNGGMPACMDNMLPVMVEEEHERRVEEVKNQERIVVGVNKYINEEEDLSVIMHRLFEEVSLTYDIEIELLNPGKNED